MKRMLSLLLISTFVSVPAMALDLPQTKLKIIGANSAQPSWKDVEVDFWSKQLPADSSGKVTVEITPWNEMGLKGPEMFHLLRQGVAPISNMILSYNTGDVKINSGLDLALLSDSFEDAQKVIATFQPEFSKFYEKNYGIKVLALYPLPPQVLYCRNELKSLADLKGRKVRVSNTTQADFVQHYGGNDVNIAFGEVQTALQTGVVDCGLTSTSAGYKTGWHEAANYLYPLPVNWQIVGYFANLRDWRKMSPELQAFLTEEFQRLKDKLLAAHAKESEVGLACLTGRGECPLGPPGRMKVVEVTETDTASRRDALKKTILPRWAKTCGAECVNAWNATVGKLLGLTAPAS
ncbi:TRAP transporter substrate-binding protein [Microvirga massiliensis]|uniref:TRAP transporter substrate-binding protein n=1 Tax=Microvirga massiliensis TaxID=1033741 RepID=UPI00062B3F51|nr:TRAP transporter substrate-binding protein [Microvirga massiliensis]